MQTEHPKHTHTYNAYEGDYPSNPFTTAAIAVKTLWKNGIPVGIGVIGLQFLLMMTVWFIAVVGVIALLVVIFAIAANVDGLHSIKDQISPDALEMSKGLSIFAPIAGIIALICLAVTILGYVFVQAIQTVFIGKAVAWRQKASFSDVVETAFRRTWALTVQTLIFIGIAAPVLIVVQLALFALVGISPLFLAVVIPFGVALAGFGIYLIARLAFANLAVVLDNMKPWQAIKYSFALTKGRVGEVLGAGALGAIAITTSMTLTTLIQIATIPAPVLGLMFSFATFGITLLASYVFMATLTERYAQFKSVEHTGVKHQPEWGSILAAIVLACVAFGISSGAQAIYYALEPEEEMFNQTIPAEDELKLNPTQEEIYDEYNRDMSEEEVDEWVRRLQEAQERARVQ